MNATNQYPLWFSFTLSLAFLPTAVSGQTKIQSPQDWKPDSAVAKTLNASSDLDWFSIRVAPEYTAVQPPNATALEEVGIKVNAWTKETTQGIAPALTVMYLPASHLKNQTENAEPAQFFEGLVQSLSSQLKDVTGSQPKAGRWHGRDVLRCDFSAKSPKGQAVSGMAIGVFDDSGIRIVSTLHPTDTPSARKKANQLVASALSVVFPD